MSYWRVTAMDVTKDGYFRENGVVFMAGTLPQAQHYMQEQVKLHSRTGYGSGVYCARKCGGVPLRHTIDGTKAHFVNCNGSWTE